MHRATLCWLVFVTACDCGGSGSSGTPCETAAECPMGEVCLDGRCQLPSRRDGGVEPGCVDLDGDGRGEGCEAGPDCDDADPTQTGTERCDGVDNDCDGTSLSRLAVSWK